MQIQQRKDCTVDAGYIKIINNVNKTEQELQAINELLNDLKIYDFNYKGIIAEVGINDGNTVFSQLPMWLLGLLFQDNENSNYDEIAIGYIMNDDVISYLKEIKKMWKSFKSIRLGKAKLKFPLIKHTKESIKNQIPIEVFNKTVWCENPNVVVDKKSKKYEPCGYCHSCKRRLTFDEDFKKKFEERPTVQLETKETKKLGKLK